MAQVLHQLDHDAYEWERLYHQGNVAPASYSALPVLCEIARVRPDVPIDPSLFLAAATLSSTAGPLDRETVRSENGDHIGAIQPVARYKLGLVSDPTDFVYTLRNVAIFDNLGVWQRGLEGIANQEVELECPACGDHVYLELTDSTSIASPDPDDLDAGTILEPAVRSDLHAPESTLFDLAVAHQQGRCEPHNRQRHRGGRRRC